MLGLQGQHNTWAIWCKGWNQAWSVPELYPDRQSLVRPGNALPRQAEQGAAAQQPCRAGLWSRETAAFNPNLQGWLEMQCPRGRTGVSGAQSLSHVPCSAGHRARGVESQRKLGKVTSPYSTLLPFFFFSFFLKLTQTQTDCGGSWKAESRSGLEQHRVSGFRYGAWCGQPGALGRVGSTLWP